MTRDAIGRSAAATTTTTTTTATAAVVVLAFASGTAFAAHPWLARRPPVTPPAAHQLNDVGRWPAEPASPQSVDPVRFSEAIDHLCGHVEIDGPRAGSGGDQIGTPPAPSGDVVAPGRTLGDLVLAAARESDVDPFLLAGLMYEQSGCHADRKSPLGSGLLRIHPSLYRSPGAPKPPGDRAAWQPEALLDPESNLRLGARLLRMWQDTHLDLDRAFHGVPHRGPVAHFVWGDVVRGSGCEDQVMTARRRIIRFYERTPEAIAANPKLGIALMCPLEGPPRVASSGPGEDRAGGRRQHQGIDLGAGLGEPVRAVADGTVSFAGANLPGAPRDSIPPSEISRYRWKPLGPGGIYVCIEHEPERHVVSCYMHLNIYSVAKGESVTAGQVIGKVGRTGVQVSPPHLHFELRVDERHVNPILYLGDLVIPPKATQTYQRVMQAKRMRLAGAHGSPPPAPKL